MGKEGKEKKMDRRKGMGNVREGKGRLRES